MTPLQQAALDFCREVLGWVHCDKGASREWIVRNQEFFDYTDLSAVMDAARTWCGRSGLILRMELGPERFAVYLDTRKWQHLASSYSPDACHALLAACLEANRKLKQPADLPTA